WLLPRLRVFSAGRLLPAGALLPRTAELLEPVLPDLLSLLNRAIRSGASRQRAANRPPAPFPRLQILRGADHRAPHMRDRAVVEAEPLLRLLEVAADHVGELLQLDLHVGIERIDVMDGDHPA